MQFVHFSKVLFEIRAEISADKIVSPPPAVERNVLSVSGVFIVMVHPQLQVYRSQILVLWTESTCWAPWTDGNIPVPGFKAGIDSWVRIPPTTRILNLIRIVIICSTHSFFFLCINLNEHTRMSKGTQRYLHHTETRRRWIHPHRSPRPCPGFPERE